MKPPVEYRPRSRLAVAQPGRAPASGAGGREFKSRQLDQPTLKELHCGAMKLVAESPSQTIQELIAKLEHKRKLNADRQRRYRAKKAGK